MLEGGQMIADTMMVSKGTALLAHMETFNKDIREWRRQATDQKKLEKFKIFFHQAYREQSRAVITTGKGGFTMTVQHIYGAPLLPLHKITMRPSTQSTQ